MNRVPTSDWSFCLLAVRRRLNYFFACSSAGWDVWVIWDACGVAHRPGTRPIDACQQSSPVSHVFDGA